MTVARAGISAMLLLGGLAAGTFGAACAKAATIEKLSLDQMVQQSTEIVRGRVVAQTAEQRNGVVYTRSRLQVLERWKGATAATVEVSVPGGKLGGLHQTFSGAPSLDPGAEYVLFLWTGKSGVTQVIGLSQGVFDLARDLKGTATVSRPAASATVLNAVGAPVADEAVAMSLADLDKKIRRFLGGDR